MEARALRNIGSGKAYNHLFPIPTKKDISIKREAGVDDTVQLIKRTVPQTLWHTEKLAAVLKARTMRDTCQNIWDFVYGNIQYKKDKDGVEQVRSPRRTWWERATGVDCDCYTEFISSILCNLGIPHKLRIAMYDPSRGWQHIYPVVPVDGDTGKELANHGDYIVIDCVKDSFDAEQPFLKTKDYVMKLEFLDGTDDEGEDPEFVETEDVYGMPPSTDMRDLSQADEMGSWFSDTVKNIGKGIQQGANIKKNFEDAGKAVQKTVKDVGKNTQQILHDVNRYANPLTVLVRNGFLLAMKVNMMNVAGRLRFGYLSDAQAAKIGFNKGLLKNIRYVISKAETIYWQAGGLKENLKKAILEGEGNKDHKVPLNGLGIGAIERYADQMEYDILHSSITGFGDLGEPVTLTLLASAAAIITAISEIIKKLGKSSDDKSDPKAKDLLKDDTKGTPAPKKKPGAIGQSDDGDTGSPQNESNQNNSPNDEDTDNSGTSPQGSDGGGEGSGNQDGSTDPGGNSGSGTTRAVVKTPGKDMVFPKQGGQVVAAPNPADATGMMGWVKANPGKTALIGGGVVIGGYFLYEHLHPTPHSLNGLPRPKRRRKAKKSRAAKKTAKIQCKKFSK
jgi:hypothetical protein